MRLLDNNCDVKTLSPLALAFVGDAVYELLVRDKIICEANRPAKFLHSESVKYVKADAQAAAYKKIEEHLNEEEVNVFKRGRNAHPGHVPKNADPADYHTATGFEALLGYLYLTDRTDRIKELFAIISE